MRFDDLCSTMNWGVWVEIEKILDAQNIRPILAVVPDNQDERLKVGPSRSDFWERVREWQRKGWSIGWHGYQHLYSSQDGGLIGVHRGSEFAGNSDQEQRRKLRCAAAIFREQGVRPIIWVAPGHSFDWVTVRLLTEHGITAISDGYFLRPVRWGGCVWVPQQLWRFHAMPIGLWTVCYHHNGWRDHDLQRFENDVVRFRERIVSLPEVLEAPSKACRWYDRALSALYRHLMLSRVILQRISS